MGNDNKYNPIYPFLLIMAASIFLAFGVDLTVETLRTPAYFFVILSVLLVLIVFRQSLPKEPVIWVMLMGAFVKASYIIYTATWTRQHDVISFGASEGHAAYIEYLLNNRKLPDFDPRLIWGFFQPPLHHIISAIWMWFNVHIKIAQRQLEESVQVLTFSYMCIMMVMIYFICKELNLKKKGTLIAMLITSLHPIYILLAGSINNDALSICLTAIALYIAILWYKKPSIVMILLLAVTIGLSMMAKLSSGMIAPGIGAMMLYKLWSDKKNIKKYIVQFISFGIVVFPIGLWWPIRNKIMWDMPINYIPEVGEQLKSSGLISRLFDIRMSSVYSSLINNGDAYDEYNVFLAMIKTSLFGEANFGNEVSHLINPFAWIVFISFIILIVLEIIAFVYVILKKESPINIEYRILLGGVSVTLLAGYLSFALSYNNFSAQDFRYAALMVAVMAIFLGAFDDRLDSISAIKADNKKINIMRRLIFTVSCVFAISSTVVYLMVGLL